MLHYEEDLMIIIALNASVPDPVFDLDLISVKILLHVLFSKDSLGIRLTGVVKLK